jgi:hypothetical protein
VGQVNRELLHQACTPCPDAAKPHMFGKYTMPRRKSFLLGMNNRGCRQMVMLRLLFYASGRQTIKFRE